MEPGVCGEMLGGQVPIKLCPLDRCVSVAIIEGSLVVKTLKLLKMFPLYKWSTYVKLCCFQYKILTALVYPLQRKIRPKEQFLQCVGPKANS